MWIQPAAYIAVSIFCAAWSIYVIVQALSDGGAAWAAALTIVAFMTASAVAAGRAARREIRRIRPHTRLPMS